MIGDCYSFDGRFSGKMNGLTTYIVGRVDRMSFSGRRWVNCTEYGDMDCYVTLQEDLASTSSSSQGCLVAELEPDVFNSYCKVGCVRMKMSHVLIYRISSVELRLKGRMG
jgi:hypothetical protein